MSLAVDLTGGTGGASKVATPSRAVVARARGGFAAFAAGARAAAAGLANGLTALGAETPSDSGAAFFPATGFRVPASSLGAGDLPELGALEPA
jgi:hypothetical protein